MKSIYETSKIFRKAGNVTRYHTKTMLKGDRNSSHSYNTALLAYHIASELNTTTVHQEADPNKCMLYMLLHDVPEYIFGDIPGDIKARSKEINQAFNELETKWFKETLPVIFQVDDENGVCLNKTEENICKFSDKFESLQTILEEMRLGNYSLKFMFASLLLHIDRTIGYKPTDAGKELWEIKKGLFDDIVKDIDTKLDKQLLEEVCKIKHNLSLL